MLYPVYTPGNNFLSGILQSLLIFFTFNKILQTRKPALPSIKTHLKTPFMLLCHTSGVIQALLSFLSPSTKTRHPILF
ncbi:hypothetical protein XBJ1_0470 [Xenorhabdus bovienii SS-2004]|uniref:Uncharacterized protein n=1 Tax=Xenorhabdus bovienii (strain SS-2004) TaxID=406818 RepID=D3UWB0_XENBS|nr:hypothetical protein XBJ1_0470 [Xenorhabdus bovienii SS-2004]